MTKTTCKLCGKELDSFLHKKYCSEICALKAEREANRAWKKAHKKSLPKQCKKCGKEFVSDKQGRKLCPDCRDWLKPKEIKHCKICGKEFEPHFNYATCSLECAAKLRKESVARNGRKYYLRVTKPARERAKMEKAGKEREDL